MGPAIEQGGRHLGGAEHSGPLAEAQVGADDGAGALIELAEQVEEQGAAGGAERQVSELVQDHEIQPDQALGDLASPSLRLFLLQCIDEFDGREEPDLLAVMLDGLDTKRRRDMGLAGSRTADQDNVVVLLCHKTILRVSRWQHGQRGRVLAMARAIATRTDVIEVGT